MFAVQAKWESFGIDWEGPVPLDDEITVTVEELHHLLTDAQKEHLKGLLAPLSGSAFSQETMLVQFLLAKSYVASTCSQHRIINNKYTHTFTLSSFVSPHYNTQAV